MRRHERWRTARDRILIGIAALFAATACTSASHPHRYRELDERWQRDHGEAASDVSLDDSVFAGAAVLERRALVEAVLERNPNVRAARYAWRAALDRHPQVVAWDDPMLGAGLAPRSFGSDAVDDAYTFDLSQRVPFPGKRRLEGEAALAEAAAASHDYEAVKLGLATMASTLYDDYYLATRSLEINAEHVVLLRDFMRVAAARYEVGEASQQDPLQAEVRLAHATHRDVVLDTSRRITAERINALLHRDPKAELPPPPRRIAVPVSEPGHEGAWSEEALAEVPEIAAASAREDAEAKRMARARREYWPDVTVLGAYNGVMQEEELQPFVGLQLSVPLQLGRRRAAVEEASARLEAARSARLALEDGVRLAVQSGVDRLEEAHHVERLFRDRLLPAARDHVAAARSGFETGRNSFLALIEAERNLLDTELGHQEALASLGRRRAELDRARGRLPALDW